MRKKGLKVKLEMTVCYGVLDKMTCVIHLFLLNSFTDVNMKGLNFFFLQQP